MALDKQINLFRVDTNCFLNEEEQNKRDEFLKEKKELKESLEQTKEQEDLKIIKKRSSSCKKEYKDWLLKESKECVQYNEKNKTKKIRTLNDKYLYYIDKNGERRKNLKNVVSMFDSTLSRSFGIEPNEFTTDIFILEIYYYDIAQDLIVNGFDYGENHYVYFSSSAGQIRTKKAVFVNEEKYNKCKLKLMCGLTIEKINEKGGMNVNKFLAYLALSNSATDKWEDVFEEKFDIDKSIVVNDFETLVKCKVDNIDYQTYEITPDVIKKIPITHTDGCGMILPSCSKKNFMVRLPFIKGLLGSFDFVKFINKNNCSSIVKDIWGEEHDILKENIQVIFTESQLKMHKYYDSWEDYKDNFKKYECEAGVCNLEEDNISTAKINYQMLQTLYNMTNKEIKEICESSNKRIEEISDSLENMLRFFGVKYEDDIKNKSFFQKALYLYPELLNDPSNRADLRDLKISLVKKYRGGKLDVVGKFTFVLPDLYAFCEHLFTNKQDNKLGLLENNEVFCKLYKNSAKLDCLRSPSLYIEHAVRNNVCNKKYKNEKLEEWFTTDAIYTSTYDLISKILQFDVDGDRLLVLAQKNLIQIAERHMEGINPLYYEMKKANAQKLTTQVMYEGLKSAFTGGNIGIISNDITKIWNNKIDQYNKEEALNAVRWLCMETNFTIDYAKTLFKPTRPKDVDIILKKYHNMKVPYFFKYAKNKTKSQIDIIDKDTKSTMNEITKQIKNKKTMFSVIDNLEKIDYNLLTDYSYVGYSNDELNKKFIEWNRAYGSSLKTETNYSKNNTIELSKQLIEDLSKIEPNINKQVNSLVKFFYENPSCKKKKLLWCAYGDKIYINLLNNINKDTEVCSKCGLRVKKGELIRNKCKKCRDKEIQLKSTKTIKCIDCGKEFEVGVKDTKSCRCKECQEIKNKEKYIKYNQKRKKKE